MYDCIVILNAALAAQLHVATGARHVSSDSVDCRQNHAIIVDDARTVVLVQTSRRRHGSAASRWGGTKSDEVIPQQMLR